MRRLRFVLPFATAAIALAVVAAASARPSHTTAAAASQAISCKSKITLPFVTPVTGGAGFIGQEQVTWAKYAVKALAKTFGLNVSLVDQDGRSMFPEGSKESNERTRRLIQKLAVPLKAAAFRISISGHTSATRLPARPGYDHGNFPPIAPMPFESSSKPMACRPPTCTWSQACRHAAALSR